MVLPGGGERIVGRYRPIIIIAIIVINVLVYLYTSFENILLYSSPTLIDELGFKPIYLLTDLERAVSSIFTSMFMHADILHIFFNMWFLWVFGSRIESILGHGKTLILYFSSGLAAVLFHVAFIPVGGYDSLTIPAVGASGAISGVLGAYLMMFPHTRLSMCMFYFYIPLCFNLPAYVFLLLWFIQQVLYGYLRLGGVAYFAHVGGFVMGLLLTPYLYRTPRRVVSSIDFFLRELHEYLGIQVVKPRGLGRGAKAILIVLLLTLGIGFLYSTYISSITTTYRVDMSATSRGESQVDEFFVLITKSSVSLTPIQQEYVRIAANRLLGLGFIYSPGYAGGSLSLDRYTNTTYILGVSVPVELVNFHATYDENGVLIYAEGKMNTISVISMPQPTLGENLVIDFKYTGFFIDTSPLIGMCLFAAAFSILAISSVLRAEETVFYQPALPEYYPYF